MDFIDKIESLSKKIKETKDKVLTEEATKNAMIMPFISILGYDPFDPREVTPEFIADVGTKKGEKVDYAILHEGKPIFIFECKKAGAELNLNNASQLLRYFHVTSARFGVLTNGLTYKFFTDLDSPNKMDEKPFFEVNILEYKERDVEELKKFCKGVYNLDSILATANDLKYTRSIQHKLEEWTINPPEEFVRLVSNDLTRRHSKAVIDQFTGITKLAFEQLISERINERLKGAMDKAAVPPSIDQVADPSVEHEASETKEELEGFYSIRAMLRGEIVLQRVASRNAKNYLAILLDDNHRKPICRLYFRDKENLRLGIFATDRTEEQVKLNSIEEIFNYEDRLKLAVQTYGASE